MVRAANNSATKTAPVSTKAKKSDNILHQRRHPSTEATITSYLLRSL